MRPSSRIAIPALILAAAALSACASVDLDPGGPDPAFVRYVRIVEAQGEHDRAAAACGAADPADPACRRREALAAELRRQGYCRVAGDPTAYAAAARFNVWTACGAGSHPARAFAAGGSQGASTRSR
ncbi:hypothetical protein LRS10_01720 [Phenylobacterium sp. J426]|uniref:hypothetical protein n=1 Tax=Phenylobacterium sp. J426 TaxID=2898439 RepID=UPI002151F7AB|nr:hypothetical protein [Phenylobacterium sp. J426]MCR5873025.1 hypothetical protein [Phenylobacterium sp. J426]